MLTGEDVLQITFAEQRFGRLYPDLDTLWEDYKQVYSYRISKIDDSKLGRTSMSSIEYTLCMLDRVKESIRLTPGDKFEKRVMYEIIKRDRNCFGGLRKIAFYNAGKESESMA